MAQVKRIRRNVSGIILLDKPLGFTSNAALQKVRWLLNAEKAGHTGSLDPLATGVLPLCFGEATKFSQYLLDSDKGYETLMQLGKTKPFGIFYHHHRGIGHIDTNFHNGRGNQHLDPVLTERFHDLIFFFRFHLSVKNTNSNRR